MEMVNVGAVDKALWFLKEGGFDSRAIQVSGKCTCAISEFLAEWKTDDLKALLKILELLDVEREFLGGDVRPTKTNLRACVQLTPILVLGDAARVGLEAKMWKTIRECELVVNNFCVVAKEAFLEVARSVEAAEPNPTPDNGVTVIIKVTSVSILIMCVTY